jgi:hypothetical protein
MRCPLLACVLTVAAGLLSAAPTRAASIFGSDGLDPQWCQKPNPRQTVVYIDDMMMADGRTDWASKLSTKLRATLAPGEHVTVVRLSPASGQSKEIWAGCWPGLTEADRAASRSGSITDFFTRDAAARLEEQQKYFVRDFGSGLTQIYMDAKRSVDAMQINPASPPEKEIIRALASDEARFSQSKVTIRAVIYSDMAENSDLGSVFKPLPSQPENYGKKLGSYLRRSVFYAFGVGETVKAATIAEDTRQFWSSAFASMNASVAGLGADLNVPNVVPVRAYAFAVNLVRDGQEFDGRLAMLVDAEGTLTDSWLGISRLSIAQVSGTFRCQGDPKDGACRLEGTTNSGIATLTASEAITLAGNQRSGLSGQLGVKGAMFPLSAKTAQN